MNKIIIFVANSEYFPIMIALEDVQYPKIRFQLYFLAGSTLKLPVVSLLHGTAVVTAVCIVILSGYVS